MFTYVDLHCYCNKYVIVILFELHFKLIYTISINIYIVFYMWNIVQDSRVEDGTYFLINEIWNVWDHYLLIICRRDCKWENLLSKRNNTKLIIISTRIPINKANEGTIKSIRSQIKWHNLTFTKSLKSNT